MEIVKDGEWHRKRTKRIGGSDIASLFGVGYESVKRIYQRKLGMKFPDSSSIWAERGVRLEPRAIKSWAKFRKIKTNCDEAVLEVFHPKYRFMGVLVDAVSECNKSVCEIKCVTPTNHLKILDGGIIPQRYLLQIQYQMLCLGRRDIEIFFFSGDYEVPSLLYTVSKDEEFCEEMERRCVDFWHNYVCAFEEPSKKNFPELQCPQKVSEIVEVYDIPCISS